MSRKDDRIEEEIRRRALDRLYELEAQREQQARQEANLEALQEVAQLPREELERIDRQVRKEFLAREGRRKKLVVAGIIGAVIALCMVLWVISDKGRDEIKAPVSRTPPVSQPKDIPPVKKAAEIPPPAIPEQTGPILPKAEAEKVLKEPLLDCLRESGHYTMYVRIGQGYDAPTTGPLAPLLIVYDKAIIDYWDVENFTATPLGTCVAKAAREVRTRAFKGNYMYFSITNEAVPDPLADADKTINRKVADTQLSAFDEEARECAQRHPQYAQPGKTISFSIKFRGVDGSVTEVLPFYVKDSPYCTCLKKTYQKAKVPPFRRLSEKVLHKLSP